MSRNELKLQFSNIFSVGPVLNVMEICSLAFKIKYVERRSQSFLYALCVSCAKET